MTHKIFSIHAYITFDIIWDDTVRRLWKGSDRSNLPHSAWAHLYPTLQLNFDVGCFFCDCAAWGA